MDDRTIANELQNGSTQSSLACKSCRRKKLKCDRSIPQCRNCMKVSRTCEYPAVAQKPGPRPGTHRRAAGNNKHSGASNNRPTATKDTHAYHTPASPDTPADSVTSSAYNHANGHLQDNAVDLAQAVSSYPDFNSQPANGTAFRKACAAMQMSEQSCWRVVKLFFDNMTSFSLFHQPTFSTKLASIQSEKEVRALLMSIFVFSIRYLGSDRSVFGPDATSRSILEAACVLSEECLRECLDEEPPLHLLQSFILQALSLSNYGVRGRCWRMVGKCIRICYQLRLHELDLESFTTEALPDARRQTISDNWVAVEEQRRAWWAVWECDVFTATILRLPVGIDWTRNRTCLPSCNGAWFNETPVQSCRFNVDPNKRWRDLRDCGNTSELAWFTLFNSYKWESLAVSQRIAPPTTFFDGEEHLRGNFSAKDYKPATQRRRELLENCLCCAMGALPPILQTNGYLSFQPSPPPYPIINLARDCGRYMIQVMYGITQLLLARKDLEAGQYIAFPTDINKPSTTDVEPSDDPNTKQKPNHQQQQRRWQRCLLEADRIAQVIRDSSPSHHRFINANAATALWMGAAAQHAVLAYHRDDIDVDYAHSNLDVLTTTMENFVRFWDVPETLVQSLSTLEQWLAKSTTSASVSSSKHPKQNFISRGLGYIPPPTLAPAPAPVPRTPTPAAAAAADSTSTSNNFTSNNENNNAPPVPDLSVSVSASDGDTLMDLSPFDVLQAMDFGAMYNGVENWENLFLDPGFPVDEVGYY